MIKLNNVYKSFYIGKEEISVLKGLNLNLPKGQTLSIVGPSGSGKTSLLSLIAGLDTATKGDVIIADNSLNNLNQEDLTYFRKNTIGIIFQNFYLIPYLTAKENVQMAIDIKEANLKPAEYWLEKVGLGHRLDHFPSQLSGGECQRLAIARALAVEPRLLIADEPSGNLDRETGKTIMDLLFELVEEQKASFVLVTHDLELAKRCQIQKKLEAGVLVDLY